MVPPQQTSGPANVSAKDIIRSRAVVTYFQPILSVRQKSVTGLEALSRGIVGVEALSRGTPPVGNQLISPGALFASADQEGVRHQLELLCRETAIRSFANLRDRSPETILFLNYDAQANVDERPAAELLLSACRHHHLEPNQVAVEVLENRFDDTQRLGRLMALFREYGFLIVLDDMGTGHSNLDRIPLIKPDIIKVDRSLVTGVDSDYHKQETFKSLIHLARKIGCLVVAEGIETEAEAIASLELGADLVQGFYFARPERPEKSTIEEASARARKLAADFKHHMVRKINDRKVQHRRFSIIMNQILCDLATADVSEFNSHLESLIGRYPNVECVYVLNEAGIQISETVCNPNVPARKNGVMFRPAPCGADHSLKEYYYILLDVELAKYTTDPYVSLATGNVCRTISTCFRDASNNKMYVLCIDVLCGE
jgi:EAL domain-containing protein (putative c-di-GMP-specific phosphodiesterase class I)